MLCNETNLLTKATVVEDAIRFIENKNKNKNKNKDSLIAIEQTR
jgi:hypothetical protein